MPPTLHIRLLGDFHLDYGNDPITGIKTIRLQSLLAYLVLHCSGPQPRQRLAFLFWPDTSEEQARNNLRNLLHFLRRRLPDSEKFLLTNTQTIQWNHQAPYTLDVDQFNRSANRFDDPEKLQKAIKLYGGDLLPDCYDDWIQPERENLRQLFIGTLERMIQCLSDAREYARAIQYTQRLLQIEPLREETHHLLMNLHAANGDRASALHTYHSCATVLERELGIEPGPEIQKAYQRLIKAEPEPSTPRLAGISELVGREDEWKAMQSTWRTLTPGQARFILISGEAGIGKTRLAEEMIDWAERQGIPAAIAHCYAAARALSFEPVTAWLRSRATPPLEKLWLSEVARLLPEILVERPELPAPIPLTENWQRLRLFKALAKALLNGRDELILLIDDLQWSDRDTLEWIAYLMEAEAEISPKTRLLVIGTLQDSEAIENHPLETLLADLRHNDQVTEIELVPLTEKETITLAGAVLGEEINAALKARLFQETEGNPLFVVEMVRAEKMKTNGWAKSTANEAAHDQVSLPEKVRRVIEARLAKLSPTARDLAGIAASAGHEFNSKILSLASELEEETLVSAIDELWRRRIIREHGLGSYHFSHDKIRLVAYEQMGSTRQRLYHRKVAEALEKLNKPNLDSVGAQIAAHYEAAGLIRIALLYYQLAAQVSQCVFTNQQTILLTRKCLQLLESGQAQELPGGWADQKRRQYLELQGDILARIGDYEAAQQDHERAVTLVGETDRFWQARLQRKIGNDLREQYHYDQAVEAYQRAQESIDTPPQDNVEAWWWEWIELQLDQSLVYFYLSRLGEVVELVERLNPVIEHYGSIPQRGRYYRRLVTIKFRQERFAVDDETVELSRKALETIKMSHDLVEIASAHFGLGLALIWHGDLSEAEEQIQWAVELTKQTGQDLLPVCFAYLTVIYRIRGDIEAVAEYASRVYGAATQEKAPIYFAMAKSAQAWIAWRQKQYDAAKQQARQALAIWQSLPDAFAFRWLALWTTLGCALAQDHLEEAIEAAQGIFGPYQQLPPSALAATLNAAIQAWDQGHITAARLLLDQVVTQATTQGFL